MDAVNMLIKPSSLCNLRCKYCFYHGVSEKRTLCGDGIMTDKTLEETVHAAFSTKARRVIFAFQGGEPTMAGLQFFRRFIELEKQHRPGGVFVSHSIQTNGILLDGKWADFFYENGFLVGLSLDGNGDLHNACRLDKNGGGTYNKTLAALDLLNRRGVSVNILCVVTGHMARRARAVYSGLKKRGCRYLQFIPCLDPPDAVRGGQVYSLTPEAYTVFLKALFDEWFRDWERGDYVSVRLFDDYVHILAGRKPGSCATSGSCGEYFVVESDGGVYPCDFYTYDEMRIGTIGVTPIEKLAEKSAEFARQSTAYPQRCPSCKYFHICRGGCRRDRVTSGTGVHNYYCSAFYAFFDYAMERLNTIAALEREAMGGYM